MGLSHRQNAAHSPAAREPSSRGARRQGQRRHLKTETRVGAQRRDNAVRREPPGASQAGSSQLQLAVPERLVRSVQKGTGQVTSPEPPDHGGIPVRAMFELSDVLDKPVGFVQIIHSGLEAMRLAGGVPPDENGRIAKPPGSTPRP